MAPKPRVRAKCASSDKFHFRRWTYARKHALKMFDFTGERKHASDEGQHEMAEEQDTVRQEEPRSDQHAETRRKEDHNLARVHEVEFRSVHFVPSGK